MAGEPFNHKFTSYFEGAAVLGGLIGMGWAIRENCGAAHYGHRSAWVCTHDPKCLEVGCECGPSCICGGY